jgi:hypothetical protein
VSVSNHFRSWTRALKTSKTQSLSETQLPGTESLNSAAWMEHRLQEEAKKIRSEMTAIVNKKVDAFRIELMVDMEKKISSRIADLHRRLQTETGSSSTVKEHVTSIPSKRDLFDLWEKRTRGDTVNALTGSISGTVSPTSISPQNTVSSAPVSRIGSTRLSTSIERASIIGIFNQQ